MFGMDDGRFLTDYRPRCVVDAKIMKDNGIRDNTSYRTFLQHNATQLLNQQYERDLRYAQEGAMPCSCSDCTRLQAAAPQMGYRSNGNLLQATSLPASSYGSSVFVQTAMSWLRTLFGADR